MNTPRIAIVWEMVMLLLATITLDLAAPAVRADIIVFRLAGGRPSHSRGEFGRCGERIYKSTRGRSLCFWSCV